MNHRSPTAIAPQARSRYRRAGEVPDYVPRAGVAEQLARERSGDDGRRDPAPRTTPTTLCLRCYRTPERCECGATAAPEAPSTHHTEDRMMPRQDATRQIILDYLAQHPLCTARDIERASDLTTKAAKSCLTRMLEAGEVVRPSRGHYALPAAADSSQGAAEAAAAVVASQDEAAEGSPGAGEGESAMEGGADGRCRACGWFPCVCFAAKEASEFAQSPVAMQTRLRAAGFDVPTTAIVVRAYKDRVADAEWLLRAQSDMDDPGPTPEWLEPYAVKQEPFGDEAEAAGATPAHQSLHGAAGVSRPMPAPAECELRRWTCGDPLEGRGEDRAALSPNGAAGVLRPKPAHETTDQVHRYLQASADHAREALQCYVERLDDSTLNTLLELAETSADALAEYEQREEVAEDGQ